MRQPQTTLEFANKRIKLGCCVLLNFLTESLKNSHPLFVFKAFCLLQQKENLKEFVEMPD
jgi:hypothetical protein